MAENKSGIIVYADWINVFEELEDIEAGKLIKHFFRYVNDLNPEAPDRLTKIAFEPIKQSLKRDLEKWENKKGERSNSGKLGNLKKYTPDLYLQVTNNEINIEQAELIAKARKISLSDNSDINNSQSLANIAVSVSDSVSVTDSVNDISFKKETKDNYLKIDFENFIIFWNKKVETTIIPKIEKLSDKRKKTLRSLFQEFSKEKFAEVLNIALKSDFLTGKTKEGFVLTFDFFSNKNNFIKVMEGNYANKEKSINETPKIVASTQHYEKPLEPTEEEKIAFRKENGLI